ncbi:MAG: septum formation initiator family protein [Candidatus Staskawiczbacteria bacterium]|nr:septum formation initiator family protein [Candidatus Staskawiczbacteria bacterium]
MVASFNKKDNREFFNRNLLFKVVGIIFIVIIFALAVADFKIYQKKNELNAQIKIYQKQIEDIKKSSQTLKAEIANSDSVDYLEKLGYEQFDQTRPGETEYMFVKPVQKTEIASSQSNFLGGKFLSNWFSNAWQWIKSSF